MLRIPEAVTDEFGLKYWLGDNRLRKMACFDLFKPISTSIAPRGNHWMTTSLEQIIQFLNNLSYCTYVGIQYWGNNGAYVILFYIRRNSLLGKIVRL